MAYFLFIDESGHDRGASPYEVLAGVAVEDRDLWNLVQAVQEAEIKHFGRRYSTERSELKGTKLLKRKAFRLAAQLDPIPAEERRLLARSCLDQGATASRRELTALSQAKLAYVQEVLDLCLRFRCKTFASIVDRTAPYPASDQHLRKDYAYLFERFFYFLEDRGATSSGIIVFDELERSQSHLLVNQTDRYFKFTANGKQRSSLIIPEPLFVHSDLTTGIQLADLVAYTISWGFRTSGMEQSARGELADYVDLICRMRHRTEREVDSNRHFVIWSFAIIHDLRGAEEREP